MQVTRNRSEMITQQHSLTSLSPYLMTSAQHLHIWSLEQRRSIAFKWSHNCHQSKHCTHTHPLHTSQHTKHFTQFKMRNYINSLTLPPKGGSSDFWQHRMKIFQYVKNGKHMANRQFLAILCHAMFCMCMLRIILVFITIATPLHLHHRQQNMSNEGRLWSPPQTPFPSSMFKQRPEQSSS